MTNEKLKQSIIEIMDFPKKGISFKDISPILANPESLEYIVDKFANEAKDADVIVGPDARGFLFGIPLAMKLKKPFVMVRKPGKLPGDVISYDYELEYGTNTLEIIRGSIKPGQKVVVVDDLLATGGTAQAIVKLIESQGASVIKNLFVIELTFLNSAKKINNNVYSLVKY